MMLFLRDILQYDFLQRSLLAALLASAACGVLGAYVVARRNSYMVGAVSHSLLGGIGLARYCQVMLGMAFFTPMAGAMLSALLVSAIITGFSERKGFRADSILSAVWTVGVAVGLCFIHAIPGYAEDLNSYLFGNILLVSERDLWLMLILDACIIPLTWIFHNCFVALCFHKEGLALRGVSPFCISLLLNMLTSLAVVLLSQAVGVVMVLALLVLPAAAGSRLSHRLRTTMLWGSLFCFISCFFGMALGYAREWPTGPVIILASTGIYLVTAAVTTIIAKIRMAKVQPF